MIHPHLIVPVVCAADGTALSLLLLFLLKRKSGNQREWTAGVLLAVSSLVIFFSSLVSSVALAAGLSRQSSVSLENSRITFSMVAFIPLEILLSWKWSSIFKEGSPISDRSFHSALLTASLIVGLLWLAPFLQLNRDYLYQHPSFRALGKCSTPSARHGGSCAVECVAGSVGYRFTRNTTRHRGDAGCRCGET